MMIKGLSRGAFEILLDYKNQHRIFEFGENFVTYCWNSARRGILKMQKVSIVDYGLGNIRAFISHISETEYAR